MSTPPPRPTPQPVSPRPKIFYGWWMAWAYFVMNFYWAGALFAGFSALFNPIREAFGISATLATAAITLRNAIAFFESPFVGFLFDRVGPRPLMLAATFITAGGFSLLIFSHSTWAFFLSFAIASVGLSTFVAGTGPALMTVWFVRHRGKAIAIVLAGAGLGAFLVPPIAAMIDAWGWRVAMAVLVVVLLIISLPLSAMLRRRPEDHGLYPDGRPPDPEDDVAGGRPGRPERADFGFREALRTRSFWLLVLAQFVVSIGTTAVHLFVIPHLEDQGFSTTSAAWVATALGLVSVFSTFGIGWLSDTFDRRLILIAVYLCQAGGLFLFANATSAWQLAIFIALFGVGARASGPVVISLLAEYFGRTNFGKIQGVLYSFFTGGAVVGPLIGAAVHDSSGSFTLIFVIFGAMTAVSVIAGAFAKRPVPAAAGRTAV